MPALVLALLSWFVVLGLGLHFAHETAPSRLDQVVTAAIHRTVGEGSPVAQELLWPSDRSVVFTILGGLVAVGLLRRQWAFATVASLCPTLALPLVESLAKPAFDRHFEGYLSFPSGHTAVSAALLTVAALYLSAGGSRGRRLLIGAVWATLVGCVAVGLVAMDYHYPTDTLGGLCAALGLVLPAAVAADLIAARRHHRRPPASTAHSASRTPQLM